MNPQRGRNWAYTGATLGGTVSIAANVAHSYIAPSGAGAGWSPEFGAVIGAVCWPVFLFVAVEILTRVAWPHGWIWHVVRWVGLLPVAGVAALVSYRHLSGLLEHYGEEHVVVYLGPVAVDGLMVMATAALLATGRREPAHVGTGERAATQHTDPVPAPSMAPVIDANPIPNPTPATPIPAIPATVVAAQPAVTPAPSLRLSIPDDTPSDPVVTDGLAPAVPVPPTPADLKARITKAPAAPTAPAAEPARPARVDRPEPAAQAATAWQLAPPATDIVTRPGAAQLSLPIVDPQLLAQVRELAEQYRTQHGIPITAGQLAVRLRIKSDLAAQALAALDDAAAPESPAVNGHQVPASR
ncbi:DUF2637 domain-containing protein [Dactylosporangium sp. NPDC051541]|uniref:DUF2637 domain-containing protein n=1 Tax=Dactylosporangium sp. NPDC051541 TaxID=3363977 RepID=UPI0037A5A506